MNVAYIHSERHELWWEFRLRDSFRWQAYIHALEERKWHRDLQKLATDLDLHSLLDRLPEELSPSELARAGLALALLPRPHLLVWEHSHACLTPADWVHVRRVLRLRRGLKVLMMPVDKISLVAR